MKLEKTFYSSSDEIDNLFNRAYFLHQHALEFSWNYLVKLKNFYSGTNYKVSGNLKQNLRRIAQKVQEDGWERITDMIRATIIVQDASELEHAYHILSKIPEYNIVKIKNKIKSPLQNVTANVIFQDSIVSEIQFRFGGKPV